MTVKQQEAWLAKLVEMTRNGCFKTAPLAGPILSSQEWLVVAARLGAILAREPTIKLAGKYTPQGYEPGETDVFHEYIAGIEPDGSALLDFIDRESRASHGSYVPEMVSKIMDVVCNTVIAQHNPRRGPNMHVYFWGIETAQTLAIVYSKGARSLDEQGQASEASGLAAIAVPAGLEPAAQGGASSSAWPFPCLLSRLVWRRVR